LERCFGNSLFPPPPTSMTNYLPLPVFEDVDSKPRIFQHVQVVNFWEAKINNASHTCRNFVLERREKFASASVTQSQQHTRFGPCPSPPPTGPWGPLGQLTLGAIDALAGSGEVTLHAGHQRVALGADCALVATQKCRRNWIEWRRTSKSSSMLRRRTESSRSGSWPA
jgi:hypothetical protein